MLNATSRAGIAQLVEHLICNQIFSAAKNL